jgi:hypothetical protein
MKEFEIILRAPEKRYLMVEKIFDFARLLNVRVANVLVKNNVHHNFKLMGKEKGFTYMMIFYVVLDNEKYEVRLAMTEKSMKIHNLQLISHVTYID